MSWEYIGRSRGGARPAPPPPPMFWVKEKESQKEEKPAGQATKKRVSPPPPLAQGLDPPLRIFAERLQPLDRTKRVTTNSNSEPHIRYW